MSEEVDGMIGWYLNLSTRMKLTLSLGIGIVFLLFVIIFSSIMMITLIDAQKKVEIDLNNVIDYSNLENNIQSNRTALLRMMIVEDKTIRDELQREIMRQSRENDEILKRLTSRVVKDPMPPEILMELDETRKEFNRIRDEFIIPSINKGDEKKNEAAFDMGTEFFVRVSQLCSVLSTMASDYAHNSAKESIARVNETLLIFFIIGIVLLFIDAGIIIFLNRTIADPLKAVTAAAVKIARGDTDVQVAAGNRRDEVGILCSSFNEMSESLENLSKVAETISEGDMTVKISPRSQQDTLAFSFSIMAENLKGLVQEMKTGSTELDELTRDLLEITKNIHGDIRDVEMSTRLQVSMQKMEDLARRLDLITNRLKI